MNSTGYHKLIRVAMINFIVLAFWGLALRYMHLFPLPGVNYMFLLHGHSHFAFAGWMFFSLALLIGDTLSADSVSWKNMFRTCLTSAFGMLISFSLQGYKPIPIIFSSLFIAVTYWFSFLYFRNKARFQKFNPQSLLLIRGAVIYLCLSSLGPFALGPLSAGGYKNTPLYQDAIYFYLHFQMNGWMLPAALALLCNRYIQNTVVLQRNIKLWSCIFIGSGFPLFFIFTLWSAPSSAIRLLAAGGALANLFSWLYLVCFYRKYNSRLPLLLKAVVLAVTLKLVFQLLICIPGIGNWAFSNRNLVIGYIHLLTLACVMPVLLDEFSHRFAAGNKKLRKLNSVFLISIILYLLLLFLQPLLSMFNAGIPLYEWLLLFISFLLLLTGIKYAAKLGCGLRGVSGGV